MALMPGVVQKPVSAHGGPTGAILGVVIHVTAGEGDPYNEFANPANQVSSHFGIGNGQGGMADGLTEQYVDTADMAWAEVNGNANYISVETEGQPTDPLTNNQILAFANIMVWAHKTYGVPLVSVDTPGQLGLITHGDGGAAWGGHTDCPGPQRTAQRAAILYVAELVLNPQPVQENNDMAFQMSDPESGKVIATDANGAFYSEGIADMGVCTLAEHPEWKAGQSESSGANPCVGIVPWKDPTGRWGYAYVTKPASGTGSLGPYSEYHIARSGTPS